MSGHHVAGVQSNQAQRAQQPTAPTRPPRLLSLLQARRDWTGTALAAHLEVSGRTIRADIERLRALGYPIERLRGAVGGYQSHIATATRRAVEPYRLVNWGRRWYLFAYDLDRGDWRTFRVDRISLRTPNNPRFTPRPLPTDDVAAHVSRGASTAAWRYRAAVIVHAPAADIAARINPAAGAVESRDDGRSCLFHTGADSVEALAVHLSLSTPTSRSPNRRNSSPISRCWPTVTPAAPAAADPQPPSIAGRGN